MSIVEEEQPTPTTVNPSILCQQEEPQDEEEEDPIEEEPITNENQEPQPKHQDQESEPEEEEEFEEEEPINSNPISPPFLSSIAKLNNLSSAITKFHHSYNDLQSHLDSIKDAIFSMKTDTKLANSVPDGITPSGSDQSELEGLCRTMCSRGIRKYIANNLSDLVRLREDVPRALRLAADVPKFVLECFGKFYLQGTKAYVKNSHMNAPREASIFVLECFLLLMGMGGEWRVGGGVKEEAECAAVGWKKRLVMEGGLGKCNLVDARGLLMLVACFGVPSCFKMEDVRDLVVVGRAEEIVALLKNSKVLMDKITEIAEGMMKNKMKVDAVDLAYTFGLEERFDPQIILLSYLEESKEFLKKPKRGGSADALNEAKKKQLDALKSIWNCLQRHNVDPIKLLPGWQIEEMISTLQKEIADHSRQKEIADHSRKSDAKVPQKRKSNETETSSRKPKSKEARRSRYTNQGPSQQRVTNHVDTRRHMLPTHPVNYSPSVIYGGSGAGLLPENMISQGVGGVSYSSGAHGSSYSAGAHGSSYSGGAHGSSYSGGAHGGSYSGGAHGGILVDASGQVLSRPQHYVYDSTLVEKYAPQPALGLTNLYRGSSSSAGLPTSPSVAVGTESRNSGSNLYQFADSVVERDAFVTGVQRVSGVPTSLPSHHSSYYYHHQA